MLCDRATLLLLYSEETSSTGGLSICIPAMNLEIDIEAILGRWCYFSYHCHHVGSTFIFPVVGAQLVGYHQHRRRRRRLHHRG